MRPSIRLLASFMSGTTCVSPQALPSQWFAPVIEVCAGTSEGLERLERAFLTLVDESESVAVKYSDDISEPPVGFVCQVLEVDVMRFPTTLAFDTLQGIADNRRARNERFVFRR